MFNIQSLTNTITTVLLTMCFLFPLVSTRSLESATFGCSAMDHAACDELCKTDYFWYGHCSAWNGVDFQCKCYEYRAPLNSIVCQNYKNYCNDFCQRKTKENGYCFPSKSTRDVRGEPQCMCFKIADSGFIQQGNKTKEVRIIDKCYTEITHTKIELSKRQEDFDRLKRYDN